MAITILPNKVVALSKWRLALLAAFVAAAGLFGGCDPIDSGYRETEADGYRTLTIENDLCSYSLEYSTYYRRGGPDGDLEWRIPFVSVRFVAPPVPVELAVPTGKGSIGTATTAYAPAFIEVIVSDRSGDQTSTASEFLEAILGYRAEDEEFELLERRPVTVDGIEGELVVFKDRWGMALWGKDMPAVGYYRYVYFDYGGLAWKIESMAEEGLVEQVAADLDHIVETFKILAPDADG